MNIPGFYAEASLYRTSGRYYMDGAHIHDSGRIYPAQQQWCPPHCVTACEAACQHDGLSKSVCARLCLSDCTFYGAPIPLSCSPCVQSVQTCIVCGGETITRSCCDKPCGPHCCPPFCCTAGKKCCDDGSGCCLDDQLCASLFGFHFCLPKKILPFFNTSPGGESVGHRGVLGSDLGGTPTGNWETPLMAPRLPFDVHDASS
jgi:hypothetical protein